jgi:hypothetical protein
LSRRGQNRSADDGGVGFRFLYKKRNWTDRNANVPRFVARLAANLGVTGTPPILERFRIPVKTANEEQRWLDGLDLDVPEEWDDPYCLFRLSALAKETE